jgi:hypothetical protein
MEEEYIKPPGMLLFPIGSKRLITCFYPLLLSYLERQNIRRLDQFAVQQLGATMEEGRRLRLIVPYLRNLIVPKSLSSSFIHCIVYPRWCYISLEHYQGPIWLILHQRVSF